MATRFAINSDDEGDGGGGGPSQSQRRGAPGGLRGAQDGNAEESLLYNADNVLTPRRRAARSNASAHDILSPSPRRQRQQVDGEGGGVRRTNGESSVARRYAMDEDEDDPSQSAAAARRGPSRARQSPSRPGDDPYLDGPAAAGQARGGSSRFSASASENEDYDHGSSFDFNADARDRRRLPGVNNLAATTRGGTGDRELDDLLADVLPGAGRDRDYDADSLHGGRRRSSLDLGVDLEAEDDDGDDGEGSQSRQRHKPEVERLREAWIMEKCCPEIRIFKEDTVDSVMDQIGQQEQLLETLAKDENTSEEEHFRLSLVALDLERTKWLLRAYLRVRLAKIEEYSQFISTTASELRKLSELERVYVDRFEKMRVEHLETAVLSLLPQSIQGLEDQAVDNSSMGDMLIKPDLDGPVFIYVKRGLLRPLILPDGNTAALTRGSVHLLRYSTIKHLLDSGVVELL